MILPSKLHIPPPRPDLVPRGRLLERLDQGLFDASGQDFTRKLSLIAAPAGFGKTTVVTQWLSNWDNVAWLSLEEDDDDLHRLFTYLAAALGGIDGLGHSLSGLITTPQTVLANLLAGALVQDAAVTGTPFILVLDDYHLLTSPEIAGAMTFLVEHQPQNMHLAITSRALPKLPLSRLRARGQMVELGPAELRFTASEATAFMKDTMGLALGDNDVLALESRTEGWAAGLQLAGLALQGAGSVLAGALGGPGLGAGDPSEVQRFITSFSGDNQYISDYLVEEVLDRQTAEVLDFLLATAVPERICGPLADALTGQDNGQKMLAFLQQKNLFIIPLDHHRQWYRYHALLTEHLRHRLEVLSPDRGSDLQRRAGLWFAGHGHTDEAITHCLAAGDLDQAATLVEQIARPMAMRGEVPPINRWLRAFPEAYLLNRPGLLTIEVMVETITGSLMEKRFITDENLAQAIETVQQRQTDGPDRDMLIGELTAHRAGLAMLNLDYDRSLALSYQAREYASGNDFLLSYIYMINATTFRLIGQDARALTAISTAASHSERADNALMTVTCLTSLAELYEVTGQLSLAEATCRRALALSRDESGRPTPGAGAAYLGLAKVQRERNQLQQSSKNLAEALRLAELSGMSGLETDSQITLALLQQGYQDFQAAYAALDRAEILTRQSADPFTIRRVGAFRSRLQLAQGERLGPLAWARSTGLSVEDAVNDYLEIDYLTLARILISEGQSAEALALMDRWQPATEAAGRRSRIIEYYILRALALDELGDQVQAAKFLVQALEAGHGEGFVRIFADEGQALVTLLARLLDPAIQSQNLKPNIRAYGLQIFDIMRDELMIEARAGNAPAGDQQSLLEPLKERELQVLRLIAAGLSNREIAAELFLTEGTVKSYTHQIYSKLGVHRRTEAVEKARELGLLP